MHDHARVQSLYLSIYDCVLVLLPCPQRHTITHLTLTNHPSIHTHTADPDDWGSQAGR